MQTLKNIHKEYLNKLAVGVVNMACVSECKCDSDDSTEKKKCLFRKTLNGNDKALVDLWFDLIDAASEAIYTKTVDDMAYPDLIREHFSQTKAKNFYEVLSDEFESVISEVYKKVCMIIPDVCRENPGFEKLVDYAEKELLEYFTFEKAFSYSRYMIENHSYIKDWFAVADMDTEEILVEAEKEPEMIYAVISRRNYKYTENLEELIEYTYHEMYRKKLPWLKNIFTKGIFKDVVNLYEDCDIVFRKSRLNDDTYGDYDTYSDYDTYDDVENGLKALIECYKDIEVTHEMYYSDINEKIGHIIVGTKHGARKKKSFGEIVNEDGNYIEGKCAKIIFKDDEKLAMSRREIYKTQLEEPTDNDFYKRSDSSHSKGDLNTLIRDFYEALYGLDLSEIYKKAPYKLNDTAKKMSPLWLPKHVKVTDALSNYYHCIKNDEYNMLQEWSLHYNRLKVINLIFDSENRGVIGGCEGDICRMIEDEEIEDINYYVEVYNEITKINNAKINRKINEFGAYKGGYEATKIKNRELLKVLDSGEKILNESKKAVRDVIATLTTALFIISPDYITLKNAMNLSGVESKKMRALIEMVFLAYFR